MTTATENTPLIRTVSDEEDELHYSGVIICNPYHWSHRFIVLVFICFLSFGSYLCYDNPAALQDKMEEDLRINVQTYMGFYAWYSWPNVILAFIGGFLIDRLFGIRLGAIIFAAFVTLGQIIFATGALMNSVIMMTAGRFVFGIGGESLAVAQNTYAVDWFKGKELNLVFGLQLSFSRVGSTVNFWIMGPIYSFLRSNISGEGYTSLGWALMIAGLFCILSLVTALTMAFFDWRAKKIMGKSAAQTGEKIVLKDILLFPLSFWLICVICVAYYVAVFIFVGMAKVFFENKWNMDPDTAADVDSMVYLMSLIFSPIAGFLIDRTGRNLYWITFGTLLTIGCHGLLTFTFLTPWIPMVAMGIAYSFLAAGLWPMLAYIIKDNHLGTAYGIMQSIQNAGLAVASLLSGTLVDGSGYLITEVFFLNCLFVALIACSFLYLSDSAKGGLLNASAPIRRQILDAQAKKEKKDT